MKKYYFWKFIVLSGILFIPLVVSSGVETCLSVEIPNKIVSLSSACMLVGYFYHG